MLIGIYLLLDRPGHKHTSEKPQKYSTATPVLFMPYLRWAVAPPSTSLGLALPEERQSTHSNQLSLKSTSLNKSAIVPAVKDCKYDSASFLGSRVEGPYVLAPSPHTPPDGGLWWAGYPFASQSLHCSCHHNLFLVNKAADPLGLCIAH